mgnify:CR=1 FL=1
MTYLFFYVVGIIIIFYAYKVGWIEALKTLIAVLIPSVLIILFNIKAGRLIFKSPLVGIISTLPTSIFIFRFSRPLVLRLISWIDTIRDSVDGEKDIIDTESVSIDD